MSTAPVAEVRRFRRPWKRKHIDRQRHARNSSGAGRRSDLCACSLVGRCESAPKGKRALTLLARATGQNRVNPDGQLL
jgi:hypothetical protein